MAMPGAVGWLVSLLVLVPVTSVLGQVELDDGPPRVVTLSDPDLVVQAFVDSPSSVHVVAAGGPDEFLVSWLVGARSGGCYVDATRRLSTTGGVFGGSALSKCQASEMARLDAQPFLGRQVETSLEVGADDDWAHISGSFDARFGGDRATFIGSQPIPNGFVGQTHSLSASSASSAGANQVVFVTSTAILAPGGNDLQYLGDQIEWHLLSLDSNGLASLMTRPFNPVPEKNLSPLYPAGAISEDGLVSIAWQPPGGAPGAIHLRRMGSDGFTLFEGPVASSSRFGPGMALSAGSHGRALLFYVKSGVPGSVDNLEVIALNGKGAFIKGGPVGAMDPLSFLQTFEVPFFAVAHDTLGNAVVVWRRDEQMWIRSFNRYGVPQEAASSFATQPTDFRPTSSGLDSGGWLGDVALDDQGRGLLTWPGADDVLSLSFQVRRDADACAYVANRLTCATGLSAQLDPIAVFGPADGVNLPFLVDWDGDRKADLCLRRGNAFVCDLAEDGGAAEVRSRFGRLTDQAWLGDLDGDGLAEPCVRRGNRLLCDTARNGGRAELQQRFGRATDSVLLGDVDGDGRDDVCLDRRSEGRLLCDTGHEGGSAELVLEFGSHDLSGQIRLGDRNGDRRAEVCAVAGSTLRCVSFDSSGAVLEVVDQTLADLSDGTFLLGDVDGF